jgi:beta-glucosidase
VIRFRVTNVGGLEGADVPQVYVSPPGSTRRLIGWSKPHLKAGQSRTITVAADPRIIGEYDAALHKWVVREGQYTVDVAHDAGSAAQTAHVAMDRYEVRP